MDALHMAATGLFPGGESLSSCHCGRPGRVSVAGTAAGECSRPSWHHGGKLPLPQTLRGGGIQHLQCAKRACSGFCFVFFYFLALAKMCRGCGGGGGGEWK